MLKVTQQTGGAGTSRRATTRQGEDLAPCPPSLFSLTFHVELVISNLDISQLPKERSLHCSRCSWAWGSSHAGLIYSLNPGPGEGRSTTLCWPLPGL